MWFTNCIFCGHVRNRKISYSLRFNLFFFSLLLGLSTHNSIRYGQERTDLRFFISWRSKSNVSDANVIRKVGQDLKLRTKVRYVFPLCPALDLDLARDEKSTCTFTKWLETLVIRFGQ